MKLFISENVFQNCRSLTSAIIFLSQIKKTEINIAISGGESCIQLFKYWSNENVSVNLDWKKINIYWVDERIVEPTNERSNFYWFEKILHNKKKHINFYRIKGEKDIDSELIRYSNIIKENVPFKHQLPSFDAIILGVGTDGHTASIFDKKDFFSDKVVIKTLMKELDEWRISLTLNVINNASNIFIFCFGQKKREIIKEIISGEVIKEGLPIGYIKIHKENVFLFTDKESVDGYL